MKTLDEAWRWYTNTSRQLKLIQRLGEQYWAELPWSGRLARDDYFRMLDGDLVFRESSFGLDHLDDLAIVVLFSVFETMVRTYVLEGIKDESRVLRHPFLQQAAEDTIDKVAEGGFFLVLQPLKDPHANLVEQINQVRRYRNWVAHGKGGVKPENVHPRVAYERLQRFLGLLESVLPGSASSDVSRS